MKKILAILFCVVFVCGVFVGCAPKESYISEEAQALSDSTERTSESFEDLQKKSEPIANALKKLSEIEGEIYDLIENVIDKYTNYENTELNENVVTAITQYFEIMESDATDQEKEEHLKNVKIDGVNIWQKDKLFENANATMKKYYEWAENTTAPVESIEKNENADELSAQYKNEFRKLVKSVFEKHTDYKGEELEMEIDRAIYQFGEITNSELPAQEKADALNDMQFGGVAIFKMDNIMEDLIKLQLDIVDKAKKAQE